MRIYANQTEVSQRVATLREDGVVEGGWGTLYVDPSTGLRWRRTYLGSSYHGGGIPILITEPPPTIPELLELLAHSSDLAEVAAGAWLLSEVDPEGAYKESLLELAERAESQGDHARAALVVGWGNLLDEMNLRPSLRKPAAEVTRDQDHFRSIAARARQLVQSKHADRRVRDLRVFGVEA